MRTETAASEELARSRRLLSLVIVFFWASEYAHVPYFTPYLRELGFGASVIGVLTGTYGLTQTIVRIPLGMATDLSGGYRTVVRMGTVFTTLSSFILIFARSAPLILFCRFLAGVAASTWIAFSVLYSAYFDPSESVGAMTDINVFNNSGKLLAFVFGTITASLWGFRIPLVVSFIAGLAAVLLSLGLKTVPVRREPMTVPVLLSTFRSRAVLIPAGFAIVLQLLTQGTVFSFTSSAAQSIGASRFAIGLNTALYTVVQVAAGGLIGRRIVKRLPEQGTAALGFACMAASCLLTGFARSIVPIYAAQILGGFGNAMLMPLFMAMAIRSVPMARKSTAMGLFQALYGIGMTAGPMLMGRILQNGSYASGYGLFAGIALAAAAAAPVAVPMAAVNNEAEQSK